MKFILPLMFAFSFIGHVKAQSISYEQFKDLIPHLQKSDFKTTFEKSSELLSKTTEDSSDIRGIVSYMNIYAATMLVSEKKMGYEDLTKVLNGFVGKLLVMPAHTYLAEGRGGFNSIQFENKNGQWVGKTIVANKDHSRILAYEYFQYLDPIDTKFFAGKMVRSGGILGSFETNPGSNSGWIVRLHIKNAFAKEMQQN